MKKIIFTVAVACLLCGSVFSESKMILIKGGTFLMGSSASERMRDKDEEQHSVAVDSLSPNAFGLYNMHGNVSEWVFDYYGEYGDSVSASGVAGRSSGKSVLNPLGCVSWRLPCEPWRWLQ